MTPDLGAKAVYEIGQAAATQSEARMGGADLGRMIVTQIVAMGAARHQLKCASTTEIEHTLARLAKGKIPNHAAVASAALDTWRQHLMER